MASCYRITGSPNIHYYQEASAGSASAFAAGDLVQLDASGELIIAAAGNILGIAHKTATGTASTEIPVDVLKSGDEISVKYKASATAEALVQDIVDFTFTVGAHTVDESGATTDAVVVDHDPKDEWGTSGGRLIVRILDSALELTDVNK